MSARTIRHHRLADREIRGMTDASCLPPIVTTAGVLPVDGFLGAGDGGDGLAGDPK